MARVVASGIGKSFGRTRALNDVDLAIEDGEFLALLGPSGCGKTTLLRIIAGFAAPDRGELAIGPAIVARAGWATPPEERNVGMVFQSYALWPHMSVTENVGFALRVRRVARDERMRRVAEALDLVGLGEFAERRPHQLSGGQKQRVALARCLAMRPAVVLLDEPLANLDAHLKDTMQLEFRRFHREIGATFVYVTHDQGEAMALADRVAVMDSGALQQVASPQVLFREPATEMVARFVGRGMLLPAEIVARQGDGVVADVLGSQVHVRGVGTVGERRMLCVRPGDIEVSAGGIRCRITSAIYQGAVSIVTAVSDPGERTLVFDWRGPPPGEGEGVSVVIRDGWLVPQESVG
jgi:iron(III) transport system ATP-binding protein